MITPINNEIVIFDLETTGLSPQKGDGIIEIAGIKLRGKEILGEYTNFINPGVPIHPASEAVHGLSDRFIATNGKKIEEVIPEFINFCKNAILVGHNIKHFDLAFIKKDIDKLNLPPLNNPILDTLHIARKKLRLPNYKLQTIAQHFEIDYTGAHRAMRDVHITREVFYKLVGLS